MVYSKFLHSCTDKTINLPQPLQKKEFISKQHKLQAKNKVRGRMDYRIWKRISRQGTPGAT